MALIVTDSENYEKIASAIREITGESGSYTPAEMPEEIKKYSLLVVDGTLTIPGAAADAEAAGRRIDETRKEIDERLLEMVVGPEKGVVGQVLEIEEVDGNGKPLKFRASDKMSGPKGEDGKSIMSGTYTPKDDPIYGGYYDIKVEGSKVGDLYLHIGSWDLYRKTSIAEYTWELIGNVRGIQGVQGEAGPQGPKGDRGETGLQGIQGPSGANGQDGSDGLSMYTTSEEATTDDFPFTPESIDLPENHHIQVGDLLILPSKKVYKVYSVSYGVIDAAYVFSLAGKDGLDGAPGPQGPKGETGAIGPQGAKGEPGYTPIKGTDYFTESDKAEITNAVIAALPKYNGEVIE